MWIFCLPSTFCQSAAAVSGRRSMQVQQGKLVLAACVGALSSLHIFLPPLPVWAGTALGVC